MRTLAPLADYDPLTELLPAKASARLGSTVDDQPRAADGSGQCQAGFIGDDLSRAARDTFLGGTGMCKAGLQVMMMLLELVACFVSTGMCEAGFAR